MGPSNYRRVHIELSLFGTFVCYPRGSGWCQFGIAMRGFSFMYATRPNVFRNRCYDVFMTEYHYGGIVDFENI